MKGAYYNFDSAGMFQVDIGMEMHIRDTRQEIIHIQSTNRAALSMGTADIEENRLQSINNKAKRLKIILVDTLLPWKMKECLKST
jgi:hypothetical protein